ncbi:hypothetical protein B0T10DRAFT_490899 [Thelonectria olida]|uniref:Uncharacterized protein n=1 Tax=Thelonectria olida TaxID=1576542 RepID=A0A9P8W142_9HYPO|nr:hypothetical protein B0T10DRAFT_490899 [Thelonectria olida]
MARNQALAGFDYSDRGVGTTQDVISSDAFESLLSKLDVDAAAMGLTNRQGFNSMPDVPILEQTPYEGLQPTGVDFITNSFNAATTPHDTTPSGVYSPSSHGSGLLQTESDVNSCTGSVSRMENKQLDEFLEKLRNVERPFPPPKIGARFSQKSTRILNQWLSSHPDHPYPKGEDIEMLRGQTGLSKTQISNWLSNARRRGKVGNTTGKIGQQSQTRPMDIPQTSSPRPGTPAPRRAMRDMNPMERWVESPPENEPASMFAIARAMANRAPDSGNTREDSPLDSRRPNSLPNQSSASSAPTSLSSGVSGGSIGLSHSGASLGSLSSTSKRQKSSRKRAKQARRRANFSIEPSTSLRRFQCTFCTEAFKTKYDWQRHERSLHVPLEKWVCAPYGPLTCNDNEEPCCAFCGRSNPDPNHLNHHNFSACTDRPVEARSFNRKDHLSQHLRLAHNSKYVDALMKPWKREITTLRSRCGFCDVFLDTWDDRVNHLADHFRLGCTMGDWKGDWGFEKHMLDVIENSMPPYLIEGDRRTPFPFKASAGPPESPASAYELIKLELVYFMQTFLEEHERLPGNDELQFEACRVILASEILSSEDLVNPQSWLRDVIMSDETVVRRAKLGPMRARHESKLDNLQVLGKTNLFDECPMEAQLLDFVRSRQLLASAVTTEQELQQEARNVIERTEANSEMPCDIICAWLMGLVTSSALWLQPFCARLTGSASWLDLIPDPLPFEGDAAQQPLNGFSTELAHVPAEPYPLETPIFNADEATDVPQSVEVPPVSQASPFMDGGQFFLHEANFHRRLERDLHRWVAATVSPKNPSHHIPSDEEIQHYARWIMYNDEDPWNQTPADNAEWLRAFKRDAGILLDE